MPRIQIVLPERFAFETRVDIRIGDINYAGHLGNDAVLKLAQEARLRFLQSLGYPHELSIEGLGVVVADTAILYRAEAFHGEVLRFALAVDDVGARGFDLLYQASNDKTGKEVARLKTGLVFFDYVSRKPAAMPPAFLERLGVTSE